MSESESFSAFAEAAGVGFPLPLVCGAAPATPPSDVEFFGGGGAGALAGSRWCWSPPPRCLFHSSDMEWMRAASSSRYLPTEVLSQCSSSRRAFRVEERYGEQSVSRVWKCEAIHFRRTLWMISEYSFGSFMNVFAKCNRYIPQSQ
jgi:hypothetical protein